MPWRARPASRQPITHAQQKPFTPAHTVALAQPNIHRSLGELLRAHKLVKVQINGPTDAADRAAADLARGSGGVLLASKGGTLLFAEGGASPEALLLVRAQTARV